MTYIVPVHFYKIVRKGSDEAIQIGHAVDFNRRRRDLRHIYNNSNESWDNFDMVLLDTVCLKNTYEIRQKLCEYRQKIS